jgi:hypothetical protein
VRNFTFSIFLLVVGLIKSQNFIGCGLGLDTQPTGLYSDTILKKLVVFGNYSFAGGKPIRGMATWDGHDFDSLGSGNNRAVGNKREMTISYKNKLYAQFIDGYLHAYNYDTKQWQKISELFDGEIIDATILNDELYLVGDFKQVGAISVRNIIKFNGSDFDTLPKPLFSFYINAVHAFKNEIYIGGTFDALPFQGVAKFNGAEWVSASPNLILDGGPEITDFETYNGKLFMCGKWTHINGEYNPSCASWDGEKWNNLGGLTFNGGITGALSLLKVYKNKLYVIGGFEYADSVKTLGMAVWNDTIWCGVKPQVNFGIQNMPVENYNDQWYFVGGQTMYGDTLDYTLNSPVDTVNYLGVYVGNHGKLERDCYEKTITPPPPVPELPQGLYPNPANQLVNFNLSADLGSTCNLKVFNELGQLIFDFANVNSNSKLNTSALASGIYFFMFKSDSNRKTFKVVIE